MAEMMRVRLKSHGPSWWQMTVEDIETGRLLPVSWAEGDSISIHEHQGVLAVTLTLLVDQVDVEAQLFIRGHEGRVPVVTGASNDSMVGRPKCPESECTLPSGHPGCCAPVESMLETRPCPETVGGKPCVMEDGHLTPCVVGPRHTSGEIVAALGGEVEPERCPYWVRTKTSDMPCEGPIGHAPPHMTR